MSQYNPVILLNNHQGVKIKLTVHLFLQNDSRSDFTFGAMRLEAKLNI